MLNKIYKGGIILDLYSLFLFTLVSFCFEITNKVIIPLIILISLFQLYRVFTQKITEQYFFTTYFYLLIYSSIFYGSIHEIILIVLVLFFSVLYFKKETDNRSNKKYIPEILVLILFGFILINHLIFWHYLKGLDIYIYYLLIPFLFLGIKKHTFKIAVTTAMKVLISSVLIASVLLIFINVYTETFSLKIDTYFSKYLDISHVYYGMFLGVANCFILTLNLKKEQYINRFLELFIFLFFTVLLIYIGARIALISLLLVFLFFLYQKSSLKWYQKSVLLVSFVFTLFFIGSKTPRFNKGVNEIKKVYTSIKTNNKEDLIKNSWKNMYQRFLVTKYTIAEIETHPFIGVGMQNVTEKISNKIKKDGFKHFHPINSHNQYLHFLIGMGIFGFLLFIGIFYFFFKNTSNGLYFLLFFAIIMLTESILVRGKGISLFFIFLLIFSLKEREVYD